MSDWIIVAAMIQSLNRPITVSHQFHSLSILSRAPASDVKALADLLLPALGPVEVLQNRTGIVMLPATDSVQGTRFHVGEVLIAEAHVRLTQHAIEGYGACIGRDVQHALAIALLDAALHANQQVEPIQHFVHTQQAALTQADAVLMRQVAATRVAMETF